MTPEEKNEILKLKSEGKGYGEIAKLLNLKKDSVSKFIQRLNLKGDIVFRFCPVCGKKFETIKGPKEKRFCSQKCKDKWWNTNRVGKKKAFLITCNHCGKVFKSTNKAAKYCCLKCYWDERYGK